MRAAVLLHSHPHHFSLQPHPSSWFLSLGCVFKSLLCESYVSSSRWHISLYSVKGRKKNSMFQSWQEDERRGVMEEKQEAVFPQMKHCCACHHGNKTLIVYSVFTRSKPPSAEAAILCCFLNKTLSLYVTTNFHQDAILVDANNTATKTERKRARFRRRQSLSVSYSGCN